MDALYNQRGPILCNTVQGDLRSTTWRGANPQGDPYANRARKQNAADDQDYVLEQYLNAIAHGIETRWSMNRNQKPPAEKCCCNWEQRDNE